jgi:hypothetical protein
MFCRFCGARLPEDSAFCHRCGKAQAETSNRSMPWWFIVLMIVIGPIGWIVLLFSGLWSVTFALSARMRYTLAGFLFPPLWAPLVWELRIPRWARAAIIAGIVVANTFWLNRLSHGWTLPLIGLIATVIFFLIWLVRSRSPAGDAEQRYLDGIRREIEEDLDMCHELIAEIEERIAVAPLSSGSAPQRRYAHALELRAEGADLLGRAESEDDLLAAERQIGRALDALEGVRDMVSTAIEAGKPTQR